MSSVNARTLRWCRLQRPNNKGTVGFGWVDEEAAKVGAAVVVEDMPWIVTHLWEIRPLEDVDPGERNTVCAITREE